MAKSKALNTQRSSGALIVDHIYGQHTPETEVRQTWEEIESMYQQCALAIVTVMEQINQVASYPNLGQYLENVNEFNVAIKGFERDMSILTEQLAAIHAKHVGKVGVVKTEADIALSFMVYHDYAEFFERYQALTLPTTLTITDAAMAAQARMNAAQNQTTQEAQNG